MPKNLIDVKRLFRAINATLFLVTLALLMLGLIALIISHRILVIPIGLVAVTMIFYDMEGR